MKILFGICAIVLLSFVARSQSIQYIRVDTLIIMKQGGNAELNLYNSTRDSTGGVLYNKGGGRTGFKRSRAIGANSFTIGGDTITLSGSGGGGGEDLQQTLIIGNTTTQKIVWDSVHARPGHNQSFDYTIFEINPLDTADTNEAFRFGVSVTGGTASSTEPLHSNNVAYFGWNVTNQGSVNRIGTPMIAMGMEQRWRPDSTIDNTEWHQVYGDLSGTLHRISSYTIDNLSNNIQYFQTIDNLSYKRSSDDSVWYGSTIGGFQYERFGDHANWGMNGDASGVQIFHSGGSAIADILTMSSFASAFLPYSLTLSDIDEHHSGSSIQFTDSIDVLMTISTDRASGGTQFTTPSASGLGMFFNPNNVLTTSIYPDRNNFINPVRIGDDATSAVESQRFRVFSNGTYAVTARIDQNFAGSNSYGLQIITQGTPGEANALYLLGIANSGNSGNKLIHAAANTVSAADNYFIYSESNAQSTMAGWLRLGDIGVGNPVEALDVHGVAKIDTVPDGAGTDYLLLWNSTDHRVKKNAGLITNSATLDFGSTSAGGVTDLTITANGAVSGDVVEIGVPNGSVPAGGSFFAWCTTDTVNIRFVNNTGGALDPASGTFKVRVIK